MIIYITPEARVKLWEYVDATTGEISGLGKIIQSNGKLIIVDVFILKQKCNHSHTDIDSDALGEYLCQAIKEDTFPFIKLWWHSHANMGVFWSTEDRDTISKFNAGWMLSMVVNKKKESKIKLIINDPSVDLEDICLEETKLEASKELQDQIKAEVADLVNHEPVVTSVVVYSNNYPDTKYKGKRGKGTPKFNDPAWDDCTGYARMNDGTFLTYNTLNMTNSKCWIEDGNTWIYRDITEEERVVIIKDIAEMSEWFDYQSRCGYHE